jgi:hypothetical protein
VPRISVEAKPDLPKVGQQFSSFTESKSGAQPAQIGRQLENTRLPFFTPLVSADPNFIPAGRAAWGTLFPLLPVQLVRSFIGNGLLVIPVRNIGPSQNVGPPSIDVHARNRKHQSYQRAQYDKKLLHGI